MLIDSWIYTYVVSNKTENWIPCNSSAECTEVTESNWACAYFLDGQFSWPSLPSLNLLVATNLSGCVYIWGVNVLRWPLCMIDLKHCKRMLVVLFFYLCNSRCKTLFGKNVRSNLVNSALVTSRPGTWWWSYRNECATSWYLLTNGTPVLSGICFQLQWCWACTNLGVGKRKYPFVFWHTQTIRLNLTYSTNL